MKQVEDFLTAEVLSLLLVKKERMEKMLGREVSVQEVIAAAATEQVQKGN